MIIAIEHLRIETFCCITCMFGVMNKNSNSVLLLFSETWYKLDSRNYSFHKIKFYYHRKNFVKILPFGLKKRTYLLDKEFHDFVFSFFEVCSEQVTCVILWLCCLHC